MVDSQLSRGTRNAEGQSGAAYHLLPLATSLTAGERSDTETVTLREARGDGKRALTKEYLARRLLNFDRPFL